MDGKVQQKRLISRILFKTQMRSIMKTFIVDSFTDTPFKGNPAGVCLLETPLSNETMLQIAQELNLSETAFVLPLEETGKFSIRFFSPKMEIELCGHATLASAKVLFKTQKLEKVHFVNVQNLNLYARANFEQISLEFPVYDTQPSFAPPALLEALGLKTIENAVFNAETKILLLEIVSPLELAALTPDFSALVKSHDSINGVLVTAPSGTDGFDFHSRYFWSWSGSDEDPVTGATHTFLTPYWASRLGKTKLRSFQASKRTGFMELELQDGKLRITSQAVIVFEGELRI